MLSLQTGNIFFVDSVTGSDTNSGNGVENALATIDAAVGKCTANKGDFIVVMPKHAESLAADSGVDLDTILDRGEALTLHDKIEIIKEGFTL